MYKLKELIAKAKKKDVTAMEELFNQFKPLLKSRSKGYSKWDWNMRMSSSRGHCSLLLVFMNIKQKRRDLLLPFPAI